VKKPLPAVVLLAGLLLTGCAGSATTPAPTTTPRMSVPDSCKFLNTDTFAPTGSQQEKAAGISKVAPEVGEPIQKMAEIMKQVADSPQATQTDEQTAQLREQINKIGEYCK
jgi:uncharacterized lipoprotein YajG